jgi:ketosteroid isomerase-like protein
MNPRLIPLCVLLGGVLLVGCDRATIAPEPRPEPTASPAALGEQVAATEHAFAATMAARDRQAFSEFLDPEAIFYSGKEVLRGRDAVTSAWAAYFEGSAAPFSWGPDSVQVLDSGQLALSTGLVRDAEGKVIARFNSVWRRNAAGEWKIVFDKGSPPDPGEQP